MSEDKTFAEENPFRRLNKRLFPSRGNEAGRSSAQGRALLKPARPEAASEKPQHADETEFAAALTPDDQADTAAFLAAMSGATRLEAKKNVARCGKFSQEPSPASLKKMVSDSRNVQPGMAGKKIATRPATQAPPQDASVENGDDQAFTAAMRGVTPLMGKGRSVAPELTPPAPPPPEGSDNPLQDFMEGKIEFALASTDEYVEGHVLGLDLITVGKLQAGRYSPESHLDLHGLNAVQAFQALVGFVKGAYLKGQRTLLVVPGRGRNSPHGMPVLRTKVQEWLTQEPFRRVILAFCTARSADGGPGALYVLLRKYKKNHGKVYWDRKPADPDLL